MPRVPCSTGRVAKGTGRLSPTALPCASTSAPKDRGPGPSVRVDEAVSVMAYPHGSTHGSTIVSPSALDTVMLVRGGDSRRDPGRSNLASAPAPEADGGPVARDRAAGERAAASVAEG